jgi:hypothetical protein
LPPDQRLPETVGGFAVDVRQANQLQQLRAAKPALFVNVAGAARPELERPVFPFERDGTGKLLAPIAAEVAAARRPTKPQLDYQAPDGVTLDAIEDTFTITCHASPDAGWPTLKPFLVGTRSRLTVGMYDFTSAHVLDTVKQSLANKKLNLVLDHPAPNKTKDQTDEETHEALDQELGNNLSFAWALERADPMAASWIYPNAYHIKVAVRDGKSFWLSSGNFNNSNQPDIDPVNDRTGAATIARKSDRDCTSLSSIRSWPACSRPFFRTILRSRNSTRRRRQARPHSLRRSANWRSRPLRSRRVPRSNILRRARSAL